MNDLRNENALKMNLLRFRISVFSFAICHYQFSPRRRLDIVKRRSFRVRGSNVEASGQSSFPVLFYVEVCRTFFTKVKWNLRSPALAEALLHSLRGTLQLLTNIYEAENRHYLRSARKEKTWRKQQKDKKTRKTWMGKGVDGGRDLL